MNFPGVYHMPQIYHRLNFLSPKGTSIQRQNIVNASQVTFLSKPDVFASFILEISGIKTQVVGSFNRNSFNPLLYPRNQHRSAPFHTTPTYSP